MTSVVNFVSEYFYVYLWLVFTTFVNIVAPTSGSTVINPVTAFFTDPYRAIGISGFIFFFTGLHRAYLFRKEILSDKLNLRAIKSMLPYSIVGAIGGGLLISYLNIKLLAATIVVVSVYFIYKTIKQIIQKAKIEKKNSGLGFAFIALLSGFLQSSGMPGSDIRNNYLRTSLSEISVRAVGSAIGLVNFFIGGTIIFLSNRLTHKDIIFIVSIIPFLIIAQIYGKKFLDKMTDRKAKILAITLSSLGIVLLSYKYLL
ncbi:MAG: sulfite exporter TauE/SafE family protein [bacterium]|nr:sulfite exporter TauE/SafE family protein [bacterium]